MKKVFALVIVVLLLAAMAAPMALADNVTVTLSVSVDGELVLAAEPITTGNATVEGVLLEAHKAFYPDGEAGFVAGIDPTYNMYMISQCWGVVTTPYVILNSAPLATGENAAYTTADMAPVKNGDNVIIIISTNMMAPSPVVSLTAEPVAEGIKLTATAWTLDFMTFTYNGAPYVGEIQDASGASLGTTGADGSLVIANTAKAVLPGICAIPADGSAVAAAAPATTGAAPATAPAVASGDAITVYVTISANGVLEIAAQPVQVTTYTVEEALKEAHRQYCPQGEAAFLAGIDPTYAMYMISQCWGVATTPYVILNTAPLGSGANSQYISADTAPVKEGDNIVVVADAAGLTPAVSIEYDAETQMVKLNQWALDFTTFQYTNAAIENADIIDAQTGEVLGTTNALGNARLTKTPACGVAAYQGVGAVPVADVQQFDCVKDKYVAPAHDYSLFGGPDGKSLMWIMVFGVGAVIPLLIIVIFAQHHEIKTGGIKYANLRGDTEITRHM